MGKIITALALTALGFAIFGRSSTLYVNLEAIINGRMINNEMMSIHYPSSFRPGTPPYLERDFEAGANFVCDEIKNKSGKDPCGRDGINWRQEQN